MTILGDCFLCGSAIVDKPHEHHWKHVRQWNVTICQVCQKSNWDGIVPASYPQLVEHLESQGVDIEYNAKGWIDIPS
jgi:hypothetical protein